uniref:SJCHGC06558 protein n=1 Tax=Schistosoma japonicum TaxID=6182 RepID=Q5DF07_SCHJA|nr:SJCHGC06558 protein [Schistosoma japonicum]
MVMFTNHYIIFNYIIFLLTIQYIYAPPLLSNPMYQSYSNDNMPRNDEWQEVPEPTMNIFDTVRNQSMIYPNKDSNIFGYNLAFNDNRYRVSRNSDGSSFYLMPSNIPQPTFPNNNNQEVDDFDTFMNQNDEFDNSQSEYTSPSQTVWNSQMYPSWGTPPHSNAFSFYQTLQPKGHFLPPVYMTSIPYQNRRNEFPSSYPDTFSTTQTNLPQQRFPLGPPVDIIQNNKYIEFQSHQPTQPFASNIFTMKPRSLPGRPIFRPYMVQNNNGLNKPTIQRYRSTASLTSHKNNNPKLLRNFNLYNRTRMVMF